MQKKAEKLSKSNSSVQNGLMDDGFYTWHGTQFKMLPERALWIEAHKTLVVADVHLGKSTHFRKAGYALPAQAYQKDLHILDLLIDQWKPTQILFLGDLFHSDYNHEWERFIHWKMGYDHIRFRLVDGNHDILHTKHYEKAKLQKEGSVQIDTIYFVHEPNTLAEGMRYIAGHIHPSIRIRSMGRQVVKLPCFAWGKNHALIPAFGSLTGTYALNKSPKDDYFVTTGKTVYLVPKED